MTDSPSQQSSTDASGATDCSSPEDTYRDETWLRTQYVTHGKSISDIATECGSSYATICEYLGQYDIEIQ